MMPFAFLIHQDIPTSFKDMFKVTWGGGGVKINLRQLKDWLIHVIHRKSFSLGNILNNSKEKPVTFTLNYSLLIWKIKGTGMKIWLSNEWKWTQSEVLHSLMLGSHLSAHICLMKHNKPQAHCFSPVLYTGV